MHDGDVDRCPPDFRLLSKAFSISSVKLYMWGEFNFRCSGGGQVGKSLGIRCFDIVHTYNERPVWKVDFDPVPRTDGMGWVLVR